ncbi:MAG: hypothetical protein R3D66_05245 [Alphaproteobacteria bacterium]
MRRRYPAQDQPYLGLEAACTGLRTHVRFFDFRWFVISVSQPFTSFHAKTSTPRGPSIDHIAASTRRYRSRA